jgi:Tfp pilus assembly protein PilN
VKQVNLLPKKQAKKLRVGKSLRLAFIITSVLSVCACLCAGALPLANKALKRRAAAYESLLADEKYLKSEKAAQDILEKSRHSAELETIRAFLLENAAPLDPSRIYDMDAALDEGLTIEKITIEQDIIHVEGIADSKDYVMNFLERLRTSEGFYRVELLHMASSENGVSFSARFTI